MDKLLSDEIQKSREHLARLRALRNPNNYPMIDTSETVEQVAKILQEPQITSKWTLHEEPISAWNIPTLSEVYVPPPVHIQELDGNGAVTDLAEKHNVTGEVCITIGEIMESIKEEEYEKQELLDALEKGMVVNLWIKDFSYFRILKVCSTEAENDLFIVNFKYKSSKPAKTTLILKFQFPLKKGTWVAIISPRKQEQLNIYTIDSIQINTKTKTIIQKALEKFGF